MSDDLTKDLTDIKSRLEKAVENEECQYEDLREMVKDIAGKLKLIIDLIYLRGSQKDASKADLS